MLTSFDITIEATNKLNNEVDPLLRTGDFNKIIEATNILNNEVDPLLKLSGILEIIEEIESQINSGTPTSDQLSKLMEQKKKLYEMMEKLPENEFNNVDKKKYNNTLQKIKQDADAPDTLKQKLVEKDLAGGNPTERSWLKFFGL